jgi:hypothetical protein
MVTDIRPCRSLVNTNKHDDFFIRKEKKIRKKNILLQGSVQRVFI